jgi:hypothetical protein
MSRRDRVNARRRRLLSAGRGERTLSRDRRPSKHYSQFRSSGRRRNSIVCAANRNRISGGVVMLTNKALWTIERVEVWIPLENGSSDL